MSTRTVKIAHMPLCGKKLPVCRLSGTLRHPHGPTDIFQHLAAVGRILPHLAVFGRILQYFAVFGRLQGAGIAALMANALACRIRRQRPSILLFPPGCEKIAQQRRALLSPHATHMPEAVIGALGVKILGAGNDRPGL